MVPTELSRVTENARSLGRVNGPSDPHSVHPIAVALALLPILALSAMIAGSFLERVLIAALRRRYGVPAPTYDIRSRRH